MQCRCPSLSMVQTKTACAPSWMASLIATYRRYDATPKGRFRIYKRSARLHGRAFKLSFMEFVSFWKRPCFYCGYPIRTIGLDRINNKKGYQLGNVRACCLYCNRAKSDLSEAHFLDHCFRVCITRMLRMRVMRPSKLALPLRKKLTSA